MPSTTTHQFPYRTLLGLLFALLLMALFALFPRNSRAQKGSDAQQQQAAPVVSALPEVKTTSYILSAQAATGHALTIRLPGASDDPVVHSSFEVRSALQPTSYHGGETARALNALSTEPAQVYRAGGDEVDARAMKALDGETNAPNFSSSPGEYTGSLRVMLTGDSPATEIYYTLDGSEPTKASTLYTKPLTLTETVTIKAMAVAKGKSESRITVAEYKITQPTLGLEIGSNGLDKVEIFLTLNAPGAASVAGKWSITDGTQTVCSAELTTETSLHCPAKLNRGNHALKATYNGAYNGWQLSAASNVRID
jgi:hypothetical protein